ncbi:thiamine diphosphate-binding protein [Aspergillus alliaceus]|uniref:thiamine diphosphate-binding protein n=1 Tax=Petromyces alliaceus TaxID=209559 RepID=UPI0012A40D7C|nr:thiamine diphosphate-binding protein [Aspergillus alliaceus]KAB8237955.1 thiamine diphosphate-binding protein [Aspergillus alliaceus]
MSNKLADYIFFRLHQLDIFGVPGDYNLRLLDYIEPSSLTWRGNCNELNAAYAADGYVRVDGLSTLVTTFGVRELSAINGIAGAYTEKAPIIHIACTSGRKPQEPRALVDLKDPWLVPDQLDWVLQEALIRSRPVFLQVPDDMVDVLVERSNLTSMICMPFAPATGHIYTAERPLVLVDGESRPMSILGHFDILVKTKEWPTWTTIFGKSLVNEQLLSLDSADLILNLLPRYSDTNSQSFTTLPNPTATIAFSHT